MIITYLKDGKVELYAEYADMQITTANISYALEFMKLYPEPITEIRHEDIKLPETNLQKIQSKRI